MSDFFPTPPNLNTPAYPTNAVTPVDYDEARRIADEYLSSDAERAAGYRNVLNEFDSCFTVLTASPPGRGEQLGGGVAVIGKRNGCVSYWPSRPTFVVAEEYQQAIEEGTIDIQPSWPRY